MARSIYDIGFNQLLTKGSIFETVQKAHAVALEQTLPSNFSNRVRPDEISSGSFNGNLNIVEGYLQSSNFQTGVNGWKFDAVGNLEANSATIRGSLYATTGEIGDWVIDSNGIYYDGTGSPSIRTAETVGAGTNGVLINSDGVKVYDATLGVVVNLPSDGSAPSFASGEISETTFEISTNAVLRTSSTVGDGSANSAGVLMNNSGLYACAANQMLGAGNVRITNDGNAYFTGTIDSATINSGTINSPNINGAIITGGLLRTATSGQRLEITSEGIVLYNGGVGATYGDSDYDYGDSSRKYGTGVLGYINNSQKVVPLYFNAEQAVADIHMYNRSGLPSGAAEIGDLAVVSGRLMICKTAGTPGGWAAVGADAAISSYSPSISPSLSPSVSVSISPSVSVSISPSISPSASPS